MKCFGMTLARYYQKLSPGQVCMYCQVAPPAYKQKMALEVYPEVEFYGNKLLGRKSIALLFKEGAKILGLSSTFCPHSLCGACITQLANNSSVSLVKTMAFAMHTSVAASRTYQCVDGISEGNRLKALGLLEDSSTAPAPVPKPAPEPEKKLPAKVSCKPPQDSTVEGSDSDNEFIQYCAKCAEHRKRKEMELPVESVPSSPSVDLKKPSMTQVELQELGVEVADLK